MKVRELKRLLNDIDDDLEVVLASDEEGNSFSELRKVDDDNNAYDAEEWQMGVRTLTPELKEEGYTEEDVVDGVPCVVLWP